MVKRKAKFAKQDDIPEEDRDDYVQVGDVWVLDVEPVDGFALEDVAGMRTVMTDRKTENDKLKARLKKWGDRDPETVAKNEAELEKLRDAKPDEKAAKQFEARERQMLEKHANELQQRDSVNSELQGQLFEEIAEKAAIAAINHHKGNVKLLLPHVTRLIRVKQGDPDDSGKRPRPAAVVVDDQGGERYSMRSGAGTSLMDVDELVERMSKDKEWAQGFEPEGIGGSGGHEGRSPSGTPGDARFQMSQADAMDPQKYRQMAEKAEQAGSSVSILADQ